MHPLMCIELYQVQTYQQPKLWVVDVAFADMTEYLNREVKL